MGLFMGWKLQTENEFLVKKISPLVNNIHTLVIQNITKTKLLYNLSVISLSIISIFPSKQNLFYRIVKKIYCVCV